MIRSPSELIRLAARTSSGTTTRSSSISTSAAAWSTTTLFVNGRRLPLAMIDSRRSTRKMMSIGVSSVASIGRGATHVPGPGADARADYRTGPWPMDGRAAASAPELLGDVHRPEAPVGEADEEREPRKD